jgi:hypothetical protein
MFNRKRDTAALIANFKDQISALEKQVAEKKVEYVVVHPPEKDDLLEYNRLLSDLVGNGFFLSYFEQLKREIVTEFSGDCKQGHEYYKGQLHLLGKIFKDSREAKLIYKAMLEKEGSDV